MEALARLNAGSERPALPTVFEFRGDELEETQGWPGLVEAWMAGTHGRQEAGTIAQHLQRNIGDLLIEWLARLRRHFPHVRSLCAGGALFFNSAFNSRVKLETGFKDVFIPVNPGNGGMAVGAALQAAGPVRQRVSPFCGPAFSSQEVKAALDNCKLTYDWVSERDRVRIALDALQKGLTVAWFEGPMEWGARALGGRSILANPFSPYVLDNLNRFLKQREAWRGYALSCAQEALSVHFEGPSDSPYMECDFRPRDPARFKCVLPGPDAAVRVQTVGHDGPRVFRMLLTEFGLATGIPVLVNTSFNAFREPLVCTPRDAIRIFYGTGIDLLMLDEFVGTEVDGTNLHVQSYSV